MGYRHEKNTADQSIPETFGLAQESSTVDLDRTGRDLGFRGYRRSCGDAGVRQCLSVISQRTAEGWRGAPLERA